MNEVEYYVRNDTEFIEIKNGVNATDFLQYMKGKDIHNIRLPLNNPDACKYLRWLNAKCHRGEYGCFLDYILNGWDACFSDKPVRPPTPREVAILCAKHITEGKLAMFIDTNAESIRDAYLFWSYPIWIESGLAGCVMKWGTFEDNEKPGDSEKYITYEEYDF